MTKSTFQFAGQAWTIHKSDFTRVFASDPSGDYFIIPKRFIQELPK